MIAERLLERIMRLDVALQACASRLAARSDGEALHDLRVNLRRLRSLLRPLRGLPGIDPLDEVAAAVGRLSTPLRDDEVLLQELESVRPDLIGPRRESVRSVTLANRVRNSRSRSSCWIGIRTLCPTRMWPPLAPKC